MKPSIGTKRNNFKTETEITEISFNMYIYRGKLENSQLNLVQVLEYI